jgi:uncharacterized membrane protein YfcA
MLTFTNILLILLIMPIAALIKGFSGLGFGIINMTIFSLLGINLERISVVITIVFSVNTATLLYLSHKRMKIDWRRALLVSIGSLIGIPVGYHFILLFHQLPLFKFFLGLVILIASLFFFVPFRIKKGLHPAFGILFGSISGFIGGAFMSGGPPLTLYLYSQMKDPRDMKSTLQAAFIIGGVIRLFTVGIGKVGYSKSILLISLAATIPSFFMLYLGHFISEKLHSELIRKIIYGLLGFFGAVIAVNSLIAHIQGTESIQLVQ